VTEKVHRKTFQHMYVADEEEGGSQLGAVRERRKGCMRNHPVDEDDNLNTTHRRKGSTSLKTNLSFTEGLTIKGLYFLASTVDKKTKLVSGMNYFLMV
jgi:hypothetical protein